MSANNNNHLGAKAAGLRARLAWLREAGNEGLVRRGMRGVEKESLRVLPSGQLSPRGHPRELGAALTHPYLTTDYSEALPEFVTPPQATNWETLQFLVELHAFAQRRLGGELLWPSSMPCALLQSDEIPIARYGSSNPGLVKTIYRRGLGYRYGRAMQTIAGVHFNFSLPAQFWAALREHERSSEAVGALKSAKFMGLVRNYRRTAWLTAYCFGASPALSKSFKPDGHELLEPLDDATWYAPFATSLRMSDLGYRNKTQGALRIGVNSLEEYVAGLTAAVSTAEPRFAEIGIEVGGKYRQLNANVLQIENEYYSAIRPKPSKANASRPVVALRDQGVEYVEVRTLDLNPADPVGLNQNELRFIETLLVFCVLADSPPITPGEQQEIDARDLAVARAGRRPGLVVQQGGAAVRLRDWGLELLDGVGAVAQLLDANDEGYVAAVEQQRAALLDPERTPSAALLRDLRDRRATFLDYMLEVARSHREYFLELPLAAEREAALAAVAADSLASAAALERDTSESFEAYLRTHVNAV